jgi:hypothetical protein
MIWHTSEFLLFVLILALFALVIEGAFRLGSRVRGQQGDGDTTHAGELQSATLVLLALLLGFTFAMAVQRYDTRREFVLQEANAIGTTSLRARFLPEPQRTEAMGLLREYVGTRLDFYRAGIDRARLDAANAASDRIQQRLWDLATAAVAADPRSVATGLFIQSLNEVIDDNEKRRAALENHVPEAVIWLLLLVAAVAMGFVAYGCGLAGRRRLAMNATFAMLITLVITVILDIDRPRRGLVKVNQDSMLRLQQSLRQDAP